jgi:hypothetical protein
MVIVCPAIGAVRTRHPSGTRILKDPSGAAYSAAPTTAEIINIPNMSARIASSTFSMARPPKTLPKEI